MVQAINLLEKVGGGWCTTSWAGGHAEEMVKKMAMEMAVDWSCWTSTITAITTIAAITAIALG